MVLADFSKPSRFTRNTVVALGVLASVLGCKGRGGEGAGIAISVEDCPGVVGCLSLPEKPQRAGASSDTILLTNIMTAESTGRVTLLRLRSKGERVWKVEAVTVRDPRPEVTGEVTFQGITWAGDHWIGLLDGGYVDNQWGTTYWAVLSEGDLQIKRTQRASTRLGAVTWDGARFWAIEGEGGSKLLKLDPSFATIGSYPLGQGCSDLAWNGSQLLCLNWDSVHRIDVRKESPTLLGTEPLASPADGLAWHDDAMWLMSMDERKLRQKRDE